MDISGNRYQVTEQAWDQWVGNNTVEEFMSGFDSADAAVSDYVQQIPEIYGEDAPTFFWSEMNAEYTLAELLTRYIEDNATE